jgi:hypothetical protein
MQGMKGLANGLDLLGKMVMAIQWLGYKNKQLKILFGGGLANVDGAPSLERWVVTLWWCFKKRPIIIKQPYSIQKGFEMCRKREVWVERLIHVGTCFMFCLAQAFEHIIKRTKSSHKINHLHDIYDSWSTCTFNTSTFWADRIIMGTCKLQEPSLEEFHLKKGTWTIDGKCMPTCSSFFSTDAFIFWPST